METLHKTLLFSILILLPTVIHGQDAESTCGTRATDMDIAIIEEALSRADNVSTRNINVTIPVAIHIIARLDETGGIDTNDVNKELLRVNLRFAETGMNFERCVDFNYIYDDEYSDFEKVTDETVADQNDLPEMINIYFVRDLFAIENGIRREICGYAYLTNPEKNRIFMENGCATNGTTLAHEIGHFFSLYHTHSSANGRELVDGSNCDAAGDMICDTPADPVLSSDNVKGNCEYIGTRRDANGELYMPDVGNLMSYAPKVCRTSFSPSQIERMVSFYNTNRNYLYCEGLSTATEDVDKEIGFKLYPNPAKDHIRIRFNQRIEQLYIYNISGKAVAEYSVNGRQHDLRTENWRSGLYYFIGHGDNSNARGRFVIEK